MPTLVVALRTYSWRALSADLTAGLTVALVVLPLAMAFAVSSGVPPESGIYTAIVAGAIVSALGGSRVQIGGPTGAFVVVASAIVAQHGAAGLFMCTMMAGVLLVVLGATGLGHAIRFIPRPVVVGFMNGLAIVIASTQVKDFLGLTVEEMPDIFVNRVMALAGSVPTLSPAATALAVAALAVLVAATRYKTRVPGPILALAAGAGAAAMLGLPVDTIESRFHGIPGGLPDLKVPPFRVDLVLALLTPAFTVALLGGIESLTSAASADRMSGDRHEPGVELVAQGVANVATSLVGGLPATGTRAATSANVRAGACTPVAGIVHAVTLLLMLLFATPLAGYAPMPVLAAIVMMVAWKMAGWREASEFARTSRLDLGVWLVTLLLTVFADLSRAVEVGMALAALLFIRRTTMTVDLAHVTGEPPPAPAGAAGNADAGLPSYATAFRVTGPLLFNATDRLDLIRDRLDGLPPIVILTLEHMTAVDVTGLHAIEDVADAVRRTHRVFLVAGARPQAAELMRRIGVDRALGADRLCATFDEALDRAREIHTQRFSGAWPELGTEASDVSRVKPGVPETS